MERTALRYLSDAVLSASRGSTGQPHWPADGRRQRQRLWLWTHRWPPQALQIGGTPGFRGF